MSSINAEAEKKVIAQLIIDAWEAEIRGDRDALLDFFSEDVIWHMPGMPQQEGKASLRKFYEEGPELVSGTSDPTVIDISVSGDFAYAVERTKYAHMFPDGVVEVEGKGLDVFKKINGVWKCVAISVSTNDLTSPGES
jgi:uncharacterized protein (TIGR02246 family)